MPFRDSALTVVSGTKKSQEVFYDENLYISKVGSGGTYSYALFEDPHLASNNNVISAASGAGYNVTHFVENNGLTAETASLEATLVIDENNAVTAVQSYTATLNSGAFSTIPTMAQASLQTNLDDFNGQWKDVVYSGLTINGGMLSATDEDGCTIDGTTTNTGLDIFSFDVTYSACDKSGTYTGVLILNERSTVTELSWMAFDNANHGVFGSLDTQITQDESLSLTNQLKPSLYLDNSSLLITTATKVYSLEYTLNGGTDNSMVFQYSYDETAPEFISGLGNGFINSNPVTNVNITLPVSPEMESIDVTIDYINESNLAASLNYDSLLYVHPELLLDTLEGKWGSLIIDDTGMLTGSINSCTLSGQINGYEEKVALVSISLAGCTQAENYSGVMVGVNNTVLGFSNDGIITVMLSDSGSFSLAGIVGRN